MVENTFFVFCCNINKLEYKLKIKFLGGLKNDSCNINKLEYKCKMG